MVGVVDYDGASIHVALADNSTDRPADLVVAPVSVPQMLNFAAGEFVGFTAGTELACVSSPGNIGFDGGSRCGYRWLDDSNLDWGAGAETTSRMDGPP